LLTYTIHLYENQQVVVLQIDYVLGPNSSGDSLDDLVSANCVVSNRRPDCILVRIYLRQPR
jgi:hypothetical protein